MVCPIAQKKMWDPLWEILKSPFPTKTPKGLFSGLIVVTHRSWCHLLNQNGIACDPHLCIWELCHHAITYRDKAEQDSFKSEHAIAYWAGILRKNARKKIVLHKKGPAPKELNLGEEAQLHRAG